MQYLRQSVAERFGPCGRSAAPRRGDRSMPSWLASFASARAACVSRIRDAWELFFG